MTPTPTDTMEGWEARCARPKKGLLCLFLGHKPGKPMIGELSPPVFGFGWVRIWDCERCGRQSVDSELLAANPLTPPSAGLPSPTPTRRDEP